MRATTLLPAALAFAPLASAIHCEDIQIPIHISANNKAVPSNLTAADLTPDYTLNQVPKLPTRRVSGDFHIGARYCEPTTHIASRAHTLQVLVHGATYDRDYWSGLVAPGTRPDRTQYSWVEYAASQGYATLAIDRLCNGRSSLPEDNGAAGTLCQIPLEAEALSAVIDAARAGHLPCVRQRSFPKIIVAGHSAGSLVLNQFSRDHPKSADALLMTGFSFNLSEGSGAFLTAGFTPAAGVLPKTYGDLDEGYLTEGNEAGTESVFFYGAYDRALAHESYVHRGTVTLGEFFITLGQQPAPAYRGPLFVLNGNHDVPFCPSHPANCADSFSERVHHGYPRVSTFDFYNIPDTGHCLNLHTTAPEAYAAAHRFLEKVGF